MLYTRTGDLGETALHGGPRVGKDHFRIEALGAVDELSSALGVARAFLPSESEAVDALLERILQDLLILGGELATPYPKHEGIIRIESEHIGNLEKEIDQLPAPEPKFVLPPKSIVGALLFQARAEARNAERRAVAVVRNAPAGELVNPLVITYLNRLSDLLYILSISKIN